MYTVTDMVREHKDGYLEAVEGLEQSHTELVQVLTALCDELHNGRKYNVRKDFSLLLADSQARGAIARAQTDIDRGS